jgi:hypothetical protein
MAKATVLDWHFSKVGDGHLAKKTGKEFLGVPKDDAAGWKIIKGGLTWIIRVST